MVGVVREEHPTDQRLSGTDTEEEELPCWTM